MDAFARRVWTAHADAWQQQGAIRGSFAEGWAELAGVRVMTSGLPHAQWNNADVFDSSLVDIHAVRGWYRERGVPWGARVPAGMPWPHGRHLLDQYLMAQTRDQFNARAQLAGVTVRAASPDDLESVLMVDAQAFGGDADIARPWMKPLLHHNSVTVALAADVLGPVGTGYAVRSDAHAGPAVYIGGIAVIKRARRRGIGAAVSSWLLDGSYAAGARLATLQPDTDQAARLYGRLGFSTAGQFRVYLDQS
jgi:ribosomal protein S18 acetylase RimI-like enzyme